MFLKYSTGQIPPKKSIWKARKRTSSRRVVKKKVTIYVAETNIPNPDVALELVKFVSLTEAVEEEAARHVHATHAWIVTESKPGPAKKKTGSRSTKGIVIQDTLSAPKPIPATSKLKLKGVQSLTLKEQEVVDIIQALKESKKTSRRESGTGGSNEGTGVSLGVPNESAVVPATSSEEIATKPRVPDEEKVTSKDKVIVDYGSEQESEYSEEDQGDDEEVNWIDSDEDEEKKNDDDDDDKSINLERQTMKKLMMNFDEQVNDGVDKEMTNAEVEDSGKGDAEISDVAKADAEKIKEIKDDAKRAELPTTSSSLSISSGFGDQFLKLSSDTSLVGTVKDTTDVEINSLLDIKIQSELPLIHSPYAFNIPISLISEPSPPIIADALTITTVVPESNALIDVKLRVGKLDKDVSELKKINLSAKALATLNKIQIPTINLEQESEKSALEIHKIKREQAEKEKMPKYTIKSTDKAALKEYDLKSALYQTMHENKSFNRNPTNHALYHALMEALIEDENAMDNEVVDTGKKTKRRRTKESESSKKPSTTKETPKGKASSKGSKTGKSASTKEPVEEPIAKVVMDDAFNTVGEDVVHDDDQPQDTSEHKDKQDSEPRLVQATYKASYS
ncbi:hypothetical protein Tco_1415968 [Tanacetum coccineum]